MTAVLSTPAVPSAPEERGAPTRGGTDVVHAVAALAPRFRARAALTAARRRLPRETIDDLAASGMLRMLVPKAHGGLELTIREFVDATAQAARGCPSTGWCAGQMAFSALVVAACPTQAQEAVWAAGPDVTTASTAQGITATVTPGGYLLSGKGPFASGIDNARWLYLGAPVVTDGKQVDLRFFIVPREDVSVLDTWQTEAMRGTGSNTVVADEVFVPELCSVRHAALNDGNTPGSLVHANPMYRLPWVSVVPLIYVSTMLGATQAAYDAVTSALRDKVGPGGQRAADSEQVQLEISLVGAKIDGARTQLYSLAERADSGAAYSVRDRAAANRSATFLAAQLVEAIDALLALSGTSGFEETSYVQQAWGDVHFASTHQALNKRLTAVRFGRLELGVQEGALPVFY